jgi:hypothetical protein
MEPVPYEIREEDVDEVLGAYGASDMREEAVRHVMQNARDIDEIVRTAPETSLNAAELHRDLVEPISTRAGEQSSARREMALAAIEDILIRDGILEATDARIYPVVARGRSD